MSAFARLAPFIREYIYRQGWAELRGVQVSAIAAVLDTPGHVVITSATASGKTEAAFLPALSVLDADPSATVGVLYVAPLKALINDQFERLTALLEEAELPVTAWHGDASQGAKRALARRPRGVLQITPESLEGLVTRRAAELTHLFGDLRFIVIDEMHALMDGDRGRQLLCVIERLERAAGCRPRRIGLSATLGDVQEGMRWLRGVSPLGVELVQAASSGRQLRLRLAHHVPPEGDVGATGYGPGSLYRDVYARTRIGKSLVFVNSRQQAEVTAAHLRTLAHEGGDDDIYHVHHGSVSRAFREDAERAMRDGPGSACTVATVTLELGIDLGGLDRVVQLGPPARVSSFVQRLGRVGRRTGVGEMHFHTAQPPLRPADPAHARVPWELVQGVAVAQLYLAERWVEPLTQPALPLSLAFHQTMNVLVAAGELTPAELAQVILTLSPLRAIGPERYRALLRHWLATEHLERTETGTLILGTAAERLVHHFRFLAVFPDGDEISVMHRSAQVGTLSRLPGVGVVVGLAGRPWRVTEVDADRRVAYVERVRGGGLGHWESTDLPELHDRVGEAMRELLAGDGMPAYLDAVARESLADARRTARSGGLLAGPVLELSPGTCLLMLWGGTARQRSVALTLRAAGLAVEEDRALGTIGLVVRATSAALRVALAALPDDGALAAYAASDLAVPLVGKYDELLPPELRLEAYLRDGLDLPGARSWLSSLTSS